MQKKWQSDNLAVKRERGAREIELWGWKFEFILFSDIWIFPTIFRKLYEKVKGFQILVRSMVPINLIFNLGQNLSNSIKFGEFLLKTTSQLRFVFGKFGHLFLEICFWIICFITLCNICSSEISSIFYISLSGWGGVTLFFRMPVIRLNIGEFLKLMYIIPKYVQLPHPKNWQNVRNPLYFICQKPTGPTTFKMFHPEHGSTIVYSSRIFHK